MNQPAYPKRLIEVDLPIKRISAHARREKSIRHGHISTLHIWWARRPLASCRAIMCASLWPDPADQHCPELFIECAKIEMLRWAKNSANLASEQSFSRLVAIQKSSSPFEDLTDLRSVLLDFIADFANWDNSHVTAFIETSRRLTAAAHEGLNGSASGPLVMDPFAGGGAIPLEALRIGADVFASDLNPVPILLNTILLEYIPKFGESLVQKFIEMAEWVQREAQRDLRSMYPVHTDGQSPIAYVWARTIDCEGPSCGVQVPLMNSLWLANKKTRKIALQMYPKGDHVEFRIIARENGLWADQSGNSQVTQDPKFEGTVRRGSVLCPCCGYTTPVASVRKQLKLRSGGTDDALLICVVSVTANSKGRSYRLPDTVDYNAINLAKERLSALTGDQAVDDCPYPDELISLNELRRISPPIYGMETWGDLFNARQKVSLSVIAAKVSKVSAMMDSSELGMAVQTVLACALDRLADYNSSICRWVSKGEFIGNTFGRQAIPMVWDFCEVSPLSKATGGFPGACAWVQKVIAAEAGCITNVGHVEMASATAHPLPTDSVDAFITDPPYYDAVPYAHLSDFFYVWLKRTVGQIYEKLFDNETSPKTQEIVVDRSHSLSSSTKGVEFYETNLLAAFNEGRRITKPNGIGVIVFASKTTASWEAFLNAVVSAGWVITGSWPIDTEMETRIAAAGQARLGSSVHLVCRPRENPDGTVRTDEIGDWRDVLMELPRRLHLWMPRLSQEGVVGADAIFACLGPALEIYSQYSRVEKTDGTIVELREYLEHVWAAVSKEALKLVFEDADASGLEEDARLTAMWLWTISAGQGQSNGESGSDEVAQSKGYLLEYDTARKIAQGLGIHMEGLASMVEISGDKAKLLPVADRTKYLFSMEDVGQTSSAASNFAQKQEDLFLEIADVEVAKDWGVTGAPRPGRTTLDHVHQGMILFAAGRSEALNRFLVEEAAGANPRFWSLAQALSALYPIRSDEKRWVDGLLARKKGLGF